MLIVFLLNFVAFSLIYLLCQYEIITKLTSVILIFLTTIIPVKKQFLALAPLVMLWACADSDSYTVKMELPENLNGQTAYIMADATGARLDSALIADASASFKGRVATPTLTTVMVGGYPYAQFILEPGQITVTDEGIGTGTPMNDAYSEFNTAVAAPVARLQKAASEEEAQQVFEGEIIPLSLSYIEQNPESPMAAPVFMQVAMYLTPAQVAKVMEQSAVVAGNEDARFVAKMAAAQAQTSVGCRYVDFTTECDGDTTSLSRYIIPGHYTVVDFWASWCGPCRREMATVKELYTRFHKQGLNVVGVAVNDRPDDTRSAMEQLGVEWPVMLNAGRDVLNTYGIMGIPCILLVNPEGVIVGRNLVGSALTSAVEKAME